MRTVGTTKRLRGITLALLGTFVAACACSSPQRDFKGASAGGAGTGYGGQAATGGMTEGKAGSSGATSADSGAAGAGDEAGQMEPGGGHAGQMEAGGGHAGQMESGAGNAGAGGLPVLPGSECLPSATRSCAESGLLGSCAAGTQTCGADGKWAACSITPKAKDTCVTGNDDSCNGSANEGCGCVIGAERPCQGAKGICANGKQTCPDGTWSACSITPSARDCSSSADNDCNGVADNTEKVCQCNPSCAAGGKCKSSGSAAQCVVCLNNTDCNNGTCSSANKCTCTPGYAGAHCEFLAFQGIGVLSGDTESSVKNVSHDGTIVIGYSSADPSSAWHAVRWVNGTLSSIPSIAGNCEATAVDASGVIVGYCYDGSAYNSFQYANGTATSVSLAPFTGYIEDISKDGKVSIGMAQTTSGQPFRRVNGSVSLVPTLASGDFSIAYGTSGDGSVIVGEEEFTFDTAWFWTAGTGTQQLAQPPAGFGDYFAADVSTDGKVIVGFSNGGYAIRWSGASYAAQPQITPNSRYAATNQDGTASVGTLTIAGNTTVAAIWDANVNVHQVTDYLTNSNLSGWTLTEATGISDDGKVVVGNGLYGSQAQGWIAHLP